VRTGKASACSPIAARRSPSIAFFGWLSRWRQDQHIERALSLCGAVREPRAFADLQELVARGTPEARATAGDRLAAMGEHALAFPVRTDEPDDVPVVAEADARALVDVASDGQPYARAGAVYVLSRFDDDAARKAVVDATADGVGIVRETAVRVLGARGRLTRQLVARAMDDEDARVKKAVMRALGAERAAGGVSDPGYLAQTTKGIGSSDPSHYATLDPRAALDTLSTFEKMMLLRNVPLFALLDPQDLEELSAIAHERRYPPGYHLCREGEAGDEVYLIVSGRVQAWVKGAGGAQRVLGEPGEGSCIGEMAALDQAPRAAWVTAKEETRTLVLQAKEFRQLLADRPGLAQAVLVVITGRLRGMIGEAQRAAAQ
jgi:hypothetical protein